MSCAAKYTAPPFADAPLVNSAGNLIPASGVGVFTCPDITQNAAFYTRDYPSGIIDTIKHDSTLGPAYNTQLQNAKRGASPSWDVNAIIALFNTGHGVAAYSQTIGGTATSAMPYQALGNIGSIRIYESFDGGSDLDITKLRAGYSVMQTAIQQEYCYYYSLYQCAITQYISLVAPAGGVGGGAGLTASLNAAQQLNFNLSVLLSVYQGVVNNLRSSVQSGSAAAVSYDGLSAKIKTNQATLNTQATTTLQSVLSTQREMVAFTNEKNRSTRNQLILYGALNAVAVGILAYLWST